MSWVELKKIEFESKEPAVKCEDRKYTVVFLRIPLQNETVDYLIKSSSILYKVGILQPACDIKMKWQLVFLYPKLSKTMKSLLHFLDKITPRPLTSTFQYRTSEEDQERAGINFARSPLRSQRTQVINSNTWQLPLCFPHSRGGCCPNQMSSAPPPARQGANVPMISQLKTASSICRLKRRVAFWPHQLSNKGKHLADFQKIDDATFNDHLFCRLPLDKRVGR